MKMNNLGTHKDNLLDVNYELKIVKSAKELSDELKSVLSKNKVDYNAYNGSNDYEGICDNPPTEIYEYQNFFVLERINGDIVLLDGFRRLLWYNAPETPILVRFYKEKDLTNQKILTLLVNLNHFKFFSDQAYHERGFSLLLKTVFDIDIMNMKRSFDAYLSSKETKNSYSAFGQLTKQSKNEEIKNRIVNDFFISDLRFLQALQNERFLVDQYVGALVYELRSKSNKEFDANKFISLIKANKVLLELMEKYKKVGTDHSSRSQEVVNKIIEMYRNIFTVMEGGEVEKSFAEKQQETKELVDKLKKDKTLVKLTGHTKVYEIEREMENKLANGEKLEFVCVIHPNETLSVSREKDRKVYNLPYGLCEGVQYLNHTPRHLGMGAKDMNVGLIVDGNECRIRHNFGGGRKYTSLDMPYGSKKYDVDLFVRMEVAKKPKSTEPRKIKEFSYLEQGYGHNKNRELCILAWTQKEARELLESIGKNLNDNDMRNFVGKSWGISNRELLKDKDLTKSCIYAIDKEKNIEKLK